MPVEFKHIRKPGEVGFESLGPATTFYLWEAAKHPTANVPWREKMWSFEVFATTQDGITATGFFVRLNECFIGDIVQERTVMFDDLDKAGQYINDQVSQRMSWGYRSVRMPDPNVVVI